MKLKEYSKLNPDAWTDMHIDEDGVLRMQHHEDVTQQLRYNAALRDLPTSKKTKEGMRHVARIPLTLYHELLRRGIAQDPKKFRAWLNDPDNRLWRTTGGKI